MADRSRTWLFDLDNTLHDANPFIFPHINRSMMTYICEHLGVDETEANRLRQLYWQRYGATLLGLMRHHGTNPHHFLHHTHQFPDLQQAVIAQRGLKAMLRRLPGRKIVFSNANVTHFHSAKCCAHVIAATCARSRSASCSVIRIPISLSPVACHKGQCAGRGRPCARS